MSVGWRHRNGARDGASARGDAYPPGPGDAVGPGVALVHDFDYVAHVEFDVVDTRSR